MDGKQKRITITVPYTEDPLARADGALWDGRDRTGAAKDGRSIAVLHADIGKELLLAWPGDPDACAYADHRRRGLDARRSIVLRGEDVIVSESWHEADGSEVSCREVRLPFATLVHLAFSGGGDVESKADARDRAAGVDPESERRLTKYLAATAGPVARVELPVRAGR